MKNAKICPKCQSTDILRGAFDKSLETGNIMKLGFLDFERQ